MSEKNQTTNIKHIIEVNVKKNTRNIICICGNRSVLYVLRRHTVTLDQVQAHLGRVLAKIKAFAVKKKIPNRKFNCFKLIKKKWNGTVVSVMSS